MKFSNRNIFSFDWLGTVLAALMVYACANRGYPEGGPKDTTPPVVVNEVPVSFTKNFDKKKIEIYFDEFVQLKDINERFVVSPPMKKNPKVNLRGKYILVSMPDSLRENTTYNLDFSDAIADNNEGNSLGYYRYVFSTGDIIDTLELGGTVVYAESNEPVINALVGIYAEQADSLPLLEMPDYIARTDSSGNFRLINIREAVYRVIAMADENKDKKYTPEDEMFAFMDSTVHPVVMPMVRTDTFTVIRQIVGLDTITSDSVVTTEYLAYGPGNLYLRMFQEKGTQLYLSVDKREIREKLEFVFSIPGDNRLTVEVWDTLATDSLPREWYIKERTAGNDTITLWIKDSSLYNRENLNLVLTYLRTDSTGQLSVLSDTNRYTFKEKSTTGRKEKNQEKESAAVSYLDIRPNIGGELDLGGRVGLEFDRPLNRTELEKAIRVSEKVDTIYQPITFTLQEDSLKIRLVYVDAQWKSGGEYRIEIDSAEVSDIYGRFNNKFEKSFKVRTEDYYGKVILSVKGVTGNTVIQMYKPDSGKSTNGSHRYQILKEKTICQDGELVFDMLPEGKYMFRAVLDTNGNGIWDTGLYLKHQQPEEIVYLPVEIAVKQNFDIEQEFDLSKSYNEKEEK